jgi:predicted transcriptional regulator
MNDNFTIIKELQDKLSASNAESETLKQVIASLEAQHQQENKTYLRLIDGLKDSVEKLRNDKLKAIGVLQTINYRSQNLMKSCINQAIELLE